MSRIEKNVVKKLNMQELENNKKNFKIEKAQFDNYYLTDRERKFLSPTNLKCENY